MLPQAVKCGIKPKEFFHLTPNEIYLHIQSFKEHVEERAREIEYAAWLNGSYVVAAIGTSFCKNISYPENPLSVRSQSIEEKAKKSGKTESELQQELLYMQLRVMQANFQLNADE